MIPISIHCATWYFISTVDGSEVPRYNVITSKRPLYDLRIDVMHMNRALRGLGSNELRMIKTDKKTGLKQVSRIDFHENKLLGYENP